MAGCALLGGETAEHPGLLGPEEYDIAGAGTGVVDAHKLLSPDRVVAGDVAIAIASSGLHSNGYSLARHVAFQMAKFDVSTYVSEFGRTLGEEFLEPTKIYSRALLGFISSVEVHSISHITGGGIAANVARVMPGNLTLEINRSTWTPQAVFNWLIQQGNLDLIDAEKTFNMGIGMLAFVPAGSAQLAISSLKTFGLKAWECGIVRNSHDGEIGDAIAKGGNGGVVKLVGNYSS
jgi:phosphoribosylformylglycinamidine cyclo-ligase